MYSNYAQAPTPGGAALGATLTSGTQLATLESQPGALPPAPQGVVIRGYLCITAGATAGAYAIKCYQGAGLSGTQIGLAGGDLFTTIASGDSQVPFSFVDTNATKAANGVYTIGVTAAGSNGTLVDGAIEVVVPEPSGSDT
jgi:hypothetical protein